MAVNKENIFIFLHNRPYFVGLFPHIPRFPDFRKTVGICKRLVAHYEHGFSVFCPSFKFTVEKVDLFFCDIRLFENPFFRTENNKGIALYIIGIVTLSARVDFQVLVHLIRYNPLIFAVGKPNVVVSHGEQHIGYYLLAVGNAEKTVVFFFSAVFGNISRHKKRVEFFFRISYIAEQIAEIFKSVFIICQVGICNRSKGESYIFPVPKYNGFFL